MIRSYILLVFVVLFQVGSAYPDDTWPRIATLRGDQDIVTSVVFPDDESILVAEGGRYLDKKKDRTFDTVQFWDLKNRRELRRFNQRDFVTLIPNSGEVLLKTGGHFWEQLSWWSIRNGEEQRAIFTWKELATPEDKPRINRRAYAITPDGKVFAAATKDGNISLWDTAPPRQIAGLPPPEDHEFNLLKFSPDGRLLAASERLKQEQSPVILWDMETHKVRSIMRGHETAVFRMEFSRDNKLLATISARHYPTFRQHIRIWSTESGREISVIDPDVTQDMEFTPDGKTLITIGHQELKGESYISYVDRWKVASGEMIKPRLEYDGWASSIAISPKGNEFCVGHYDGNIYIFAIPPVASP